MHRHFLLVATLSLVASGCATMKQSDTARTGVEQLLVSSAIDRSLDRVDMRTIAGAKVYVEQKYLDCVDKNYVVVALHQRLMRNGCTLVEKQEESDVTIELGSGGVGTDRQELFVGIPAMTVPMPLPVSIPQVPFFNRVRYNGTAKIAIVAYDTKTKSPVINSGAMLARSDHKSWNVLGTGHVVTGSVPDEIVRATGESESIVQIPTVATSRPTNPSR
jgi:hypothetical protein